MSGYLNSGHGRRKALIPIICVLDILLFPYIRFLSCSLSMLLVLAWSAYHYRSIFKEAKETVGVVLLIGISHLVGLFIYDDFSGISTSVIVIFSLLLCYYLKVMGVEIPTRKILLVYLFVAFVLALIYLVNPRLYFDIRSFWTMSGEEIDFTQHTISRYTFNFSDPNNAACAFVGILAYLLLFEKIQSLPMVLFCIVSVCVCVVVTFSVSGIVMLVFTLAILTITRSVNKPFYNVAIIVLSFFGLLVLLSLGSAFLEDNVIFETLFNRIEGNTQNSSLGGRTDIWENVIEKTFTWFNLFIGKGAVIDNKAVVFKPHSGVLYFLIAYGLLAGVLFIKAFFNKKLFLQKTLKYLIVIAPFCVIFMINTGLSDYRFMSVFALIAAAMPNKAIGHFNYNTALK